MSFALPFSLENGTDADANQVQANFDALANRAAAMPVDSLAPGTAGQIIVCNSSGVPTYRAVTGSVALNSSGGTALVRHYDEASVSGTVNHTGSFTNVTSFDILTSGTYLILGKLFLFTNGGPAQRLYGRLLSGLGQIDYSENQSDQFSLNAASICLIKQAALTSGQTITLQAGGLTFGAATITAQDGRLSAIRVG